MLIKRKCPFMNLIYVICSFPLNLCYEHYFIEMYTDKRRYSSIYTLNSWSLLNLGVFLVCWYENWFKRVKHRLCQCQNHGKVFPLHNFLIFILFPWNSIFLFQFIALQSYFERKPFSTTLYSFFWIIYFLKFEIQTFI